MSALSPLSIRLLCDIAQKFSFSDLNTGGVPTWVRGDDVTIEIGIGEDGVLLPPPLSNVASVTCQLFEEENDTNPPVLSQTVLAASMNLTLTAANWTGNSSGNCHAAFTFTNAQTAVNLDGAAQSQFWLRIFATTADAPAKIVTLLEGWILIKDGPVSEVSAPPAAAFKIVTLPSGQATLAIYDPTSGNYFTLEIDTVEGIRTLSLGDTPY